MRAWNEPRQLERAGGQGERRKWGWAALMRNGRKSEKADNWQQLLNQEMNVRGTLESTPSAPATAPTDNPHNLGPQPQPARVHRFCGMPVYPSGPGMCSETGTLVSKGGPWSQVAAPGEWGGGGGWRWGRPPAPLWTQGCWRTWRHSETGSKRTWGYDGRSGREGVTTRH